MSKDVKYFPGLDGLRFIGAFAVILSHIEFLKSLYGFENLMKYGFYQKTNGHLGVILFFVISGYLITYLLLKEYNTNKTINIKHFYLRRVLRIWPLYYLMVIISVFLVPYFFDKVGFRYNSFEFKETIYYFLFLPNVAKSLMFSIDGIVHLWSVGIEEQFYLIWPWVVLLFRKNLKIILSIIFIGISLLPFLISYIHSHGIMLEDDSLYKILLSNAYQLKINSMAIGGLFSYLYFNNSTLLKVFYKFKLELILIPLTFLFWISGITFGPFSDEIYSTLFAIIILIVSTKTNSLIKLNSRISMFLGQISYGLYVYHWLIIILVLNFVKKFMNDFSVFNQNMIIYFFTITITILISHFSYKYFESFFLKFKTKFY